MLKKEKGTILIISILTMTILSGLSIYLLANSAAESLIGQNSQDQQLAQQSANQAVSVAKQQLSENWAIGMSQCTTYPCTCQSGAPCVWNKVATGVVGNEYTQQPQSWWDQYSTTVAKPESQLNAAPQYIIIDWGCDAISGQENYRIISKASGATAQAVAFGDTLFSMPINSNNVIYTPAAIQVYARVDGVLEQTYQLSPSTMSYPQYPAFFSNGNSCTAGASHAECQVNCAGQIRVMAWTYDNNNCAPVYGAWSNASSLIHLTLNGTTHQLTCKPN